ncbi:MAG TPA: hypothetical protein QGI30_04615, partial [Anaerolineales bacterium]|nr:hypothetical protein [Anaerolineales bacterium]
MSNKTQRKTGTRSRKSQRGGLTGEQKMDVMGVLLALVGILLLLAFFSPNNSPIVRRLVQALRQLFGLGRFVAPFVCLAMGIWVILRHFSEQLPRIRPEQVLGAMLLFLAVLTSLGADGGSGGVLGHYLLQSLMEGLG